MGNGEILSFQITKKRGNPVSAPYPLIPCPLPPMLSLSQSQLISVPALHAFAPTNVFFQGWEITYPSLKVVRRKSFSHQFILLEKKWRGEKFAPLASNASTYKFPAYSVRIEQNLFEGRRHEGEENYSTKPKYQLSDGQYHWRRAIRYFKFSLAATTSFSRATTIIPYNLS